MKHFKTKIGLIVVVITVGIFAVAFAHGWDHAGSGGHRMSYGMGYYGHVMNDGHNGYGNLSSEDAAKLKQAQEEFFNDTKELRDTILEKQLALNQEIEKAEPDRGRAADLQEELSNLESEYDQKVLEHRLDLRNTFPDTALTMGYGHGGYCR